MRLFAFVVLLLLAGAASAQAPKSPPTVGYWWNPNESGRGWNIEVQNDVVAITHFVYRPDGSATFLQSAGPFDLTTGVVSATLNQFGQGQCIGCPYTRPVTTSIGTVRFEFPNDSQGQVIYPDGTIINIQPFVYGYSNALSATFGTWSTNWAGVTGALFSGIYQFYRETQINPTLRAAEGRRIFPTGNRLILASEVNGVYLMVADVSSSFNEAFYVIANVRDFQGLACPYPKGSNPPGINDCRGALFGQRIYSNAQSLRLFPVAGSAADAKITSPHDVERAEEMRAHSTAAQALPLALAKAAHDPAVYAAAHALNQALGKASE
jgi:hypothetical protein